MKKIVIICICLGWGMSAGLCMAEEDAGIFSELNKVYDITYQLNRYETATIRAAKILTPRKFGNGSFLLLKKDRFGGEGRYAYLRMDHIILIAESGFDPGVKSIKIDSKGK